MGTWTSWLCEDSVLAVNLSDSRDSMDVYMDSTECEVEWCPPHLPKRISKMWPVEQKPGTSCKYWFWVRGNFIYTGCFSAKLRLLHQTVTGSLSCIILNYGAQLCYYKEAMGSNSQATQWNMGMHCYGQPSTCFQKCIQFSSLYTLVFLSIDKRKSPNCLRWLSSCLLKQHVSIVCDTIVCGDIKIYRSNIKTYVFSKCCFHLHYIACAP